MQHEPQHPAVIRWVDERFPIVAFYNKHLGRYYAPKNFNIWYIGGSLLLTIFAIQLVTGIFLAMHYKPDASQAFASVEYIMRDVPWGWLVRYMHSTGASAFFVVIYLHMFRGLIYGSYRKPRELVWLFGCTIFLCLMAEAFMGYLLPWGQMSYWGAQVIINLFASVPFVGPDLALLIRGDYIVSDATLNRFFSLHVVAVPLALIGLVTAHIFALHEVGSNNPDGIEIKENTDTDGVPLDGIPFQPYYTVHDIYWVMVFLTCYFAVVFLAPEGGGYLLEYNNFIEANPLKTPPHIAPVWYFTPFYSMLRATTDVLVNALCVIAGLAGGAAIALKAIAPRYKLVVGAGVLIAVALLKAFEAKFVGVLVMGGAVVLLYFVPWLDRSPVRSVRYRPDWHKALYGAFVVSSLVLGYLGTKPPSAASTVVSQVLTIAYFSFFVLMPVWTHRGTFKPLPTRVNFDPY
jgi:ubiquinol-cytochrome c reductase cytochrome b subunit